MKHTIATLVSIAAIIAAGVMSVNVHRQAIQQQLVQDARQAATAARQAAQEQLAARETARQLQTAQTSVQRLKTQCESYQIAYNMLTPSQKDHVVKPDCSL